MRLHALAYQAASQPFGVADRLITYVVIQTQTEWAEFVRSFLLSCISGATRQNGHAVTVKLATARRQSEMMRLALVIQTHGRKNKPPRRRRDEPAWHSTNLLVQLAARIGLSNEPTISAAVSTGSTVFGGLPTLRNFYAHRNQDSKQNALLELQRLAVPLFAHPTLSLLAAPAGSTSPLVVDWIADLHASVGLMCK